MTWLDLITDALLEIGAFAPGDTIPAPVLDISLRRLNRRINEWAALDRYAYNVNFTLYTITPSHQPTLLGPGLSSPDFATVNNQPRPPRIVGATLVLGGSNPTTDLIINVRDDAWWLAQQVKNLTSTIPTDLYYSPDYPNGAIYLWPIPTVANGIRLETWVQATAITEDDLGTTFTAPPAYEAALVLTLAEDLTTPMARPMPDTLPGRARQARVDFQSNNISSPRIASADYGTGFGRRGGFNYRSGLPA